MNRMKRHFLALSLCGLSGLAFGAPMSGLYAFYTFEGNANDVSGNGRNGSLGGGSQAPTLSASGYQGQAYSFNSGERDYIQVPVNIDPTAMTRVTFGAWVNSSSSSGLRAIISSDNGSFDRSLYQDTRGGGGYSYSAFTGSGVLAGSPITTGVWHFVAGAWDQTAGTLSLYVDGTKYTATANEGASHAFTWIGNNPSFSGETFSGLIDNVFFFDRVLSDAEIATIHSAGANAILGTALPEPAVPGLLLASLGGLALRRRT